MRFFYVLQSGTNHSVPCLLDYSYCYAGKRTHRGGVIMAHVLKPLGAEESIRTKPADALCSRAAGPWVLFVTILGSSMGFIDGTVVNVALPTIQRDFGATGGSVQWVIEAYSLFLSALILVGGSLGDRLGRRRVFSAGIVLFTIASVA